MLTPDDLRDIVSVLDSTELDELHIETSELSITLRRDGSHGDWAAESHVSKEARHHHVGHSGSLDAGKGVTTSAAGPAAESPESSPGAEGLHRVTPPLLGTFYRAPRPGAPPFVDVGSTVGPETVVGIIETMKMMNSVYAGVSGVVKQICLEDAHFADTDTALMLVEESR